MATVDNREVLDNWFKALNSRQFDDLRDILANHVSPDLVQEWPQSGERIRGTKNLLAVFQNYPGLPKVELKNVAGAQDKWVLTPSWTPLRISGTGDEFTVESKVAYPNGEVWHAVTILKLRNGKVTNVTEYFAAPFPAAEWRAEWVEKI